MLARAHRITRGADYRSVVRRGRRCVAAHVMSYTTVSADAGPSRFGFIVSKQVGSAVTRNTVRRRLKAISAGLVDEIRPGSQVVIRALPAAAEAPYDILAGELTRCLTGERR
ncbi:ribonuclease P protein component [Microbacterium schleiferi]|uniref:Ribonuclease P protein component n=1 Tax=Microbacterium schleiferi TaxID=69362 RepID=A0A7S8MWR5_9MICO|nr:ribonuclease P protein component [Microbacterium schleiferi]